MTSDSQEMDTKLVSAHDGSTVPKADEACNVCGGFKKLDGLAVGNSNATRDSASGGTWKIPMGENGQMAMRIL